MGEEFADIQKFCRWWQTRADTVKGPVVANAVIQCVVSIAVKRHAVTFTIKRLVVTNTLNGDMVTFTVKQPVVTNTLDGDVVTSSGQGQAMTALQRR